MTVRYRLVCACVLWAASVCSCVVVRTVRISPEDEAVLARQLSAPQPGARAVSAHLLLIVSARKYTPAVGKQLQEETNNSAALKMIESLGALGTREAIPFLETRLEDHSKVQISIGRGPDEERAMRPPDTYVISDAAAEAIQRITGRSGPRTSRACLSNRALGGQRP